MKEILKETIKRWNLPSPDYFIKIRKILVTLGIIIATCGFIADEFELTKFRGYLEIAGLMLAKIAYVVTKLAVDWQKAEETLKSKELIDNTIK